MYLYEAVFAVLKNLFDKYNNKITQHITINLIVAVGKCLATGTLSEEKADS